jgi:hypothetical protein
MSFREILNDWKVYSPEIKEIRKGMKSSEAE